MEKFSQVRKLGLRVGLRGEVDHFGKQDFYSQLAASFISFLTIGYYTRCMQ